MGLVEDSVTLRQKVEEEDTLETEEANKTNP
jgi:hypothetical protein